MYSSAVEECPLLWFKSSVIVVPVLCYYVSSCLLLCFQSSVIMVQVAYCYVSSPLLLYFQPYVFMVQVLCYYGSRPLLLWFPSSVNVVPVLCYYVSSPHREHFLPRKQRWTFMIFNSLHTMSSLSGFFKKKHYSRNFVLFSDIFNFRLNKFIYMQIGINQLPYFIVTVNLFFITKTLVRHR